MALSEWAVRGLITFHTTRPMSSPMVISPLSLLQKPHVVVVTAAASAAAAATAAKQSKDSGRITLEFSAKSFDIPSL
jgi:hypothetical protein